MYRKPDVIVLTETWLDESTCEYATISYVGFHTYRTGRRGGGVSVFVREGLGGRLMEAASLVSDIMESCSVQVTYNNIVFTVIGVYRPPAEFVRHFVDHINSFLHDEFSNCESMYIAGDFNVDLINVDCNAVEYLVNSLRQLHFVQTITKPTRFPPNDNSNGGSLLDHIWFNDPEMFTSGILLCDVSDHCPTFLMHRLEVAMKLMRSKFRSVI